MHNKSTDVLAKLVWNYMLLNDFPKRSDGIVCLGSHDTRVAERAAELFLKGMASYVVFSGGLGRLTNGIFKEAEAEIFARTAITLGVPKDKVFIEKESTNTGDNIICTYKLLKAYNLPVKSLILVQKPYMERRTYATFKKLWPDKTTDVIVTSPQLDFNQYPNNDISKEDVINIMVGDLQRIKEYPSLGFQIYQEIPDEVWNAYLVLVDRGYDKQLITNHPFKEQN